MAPKSNTVYLAIAKAAEDAERGQLGEVPIRLRDTHYAGFQRLGNGKATCTRTTFPDTGSGRVTCPTAIMTLSTTSRANWDLRTAAQKEG